MSRKTKPTVKQTPTVEVPWKAILSCLFAVAVFLFYVLKQTHLIIYQEWGQMFQFTSEYFIDRIAVPGGLARYLGEFFTQFYHTPWVGAVIIALLATAVHRLSWAIARRDGAGDAAFPISFVPALLLLAFMSYADTLLSYPIAMAAALLSCLLFRPTRKNALILLPYIAVFYHLFGTTAYIVALYEAAMLVAIGIREKKAASCCLLAAMLTAWTFAVVWISTFYTPYPLWRIFKGIPYYSVPTEIPSLQFHSMWITSAAIAAMALLPRWKMKPIITSAITVVLVAVGMKLTAEKYNTDLNYLISYDSLVYTEQWDKILNRKDIFDKVSTMSVACCDLALAIRGQLADNLFDYPQMGAEGLFLFMQRDNLSSNVIGEILFRIGMVNEAQRFFYDSQESLFNHNKSTRLTKRLTEIEIVNGQYDVARKYLHQLAKTLYYRGWANEQLLLLGNEDAINNHPLYGRLRSLRSTEDYIFQPNRLFYILESLYKQNPDNFLANRYMQAAIPLIKSKKRP